MPDDADAARFTALAMFAEQNDPWIEFAEGQKMKMIERGWSPAAAEQYALVVLCGLTRMGLRAIGAQ